MDMHASALPSTMWISIVPPPTRAANTYGFCGGVAGNRVAASQSDMPVTLPTVPMASAPMTKKMIGQLTPVLMSLASSTSPTTGSDSPTTAPNATQAGSI